MIDPFDIWGVFCSRVNLDQNGWFRPQTDFIRSLNEASYGLWMELTEQAEKDQGGTDLLRPFLLTKNIIVSAQSAYFGLAKYPDQYGRFGSARVIAHTTGCLPDKEVDCGKCYDGSDVREEDEIASDYYDTVREYTVEKIDNKSWGAVCDHLLKGPKFPTSVKITQFEGGFKVAPRNVSVIVMDYYREPKKATFAYTLTPGNPQTGAGDSILYDEAASDKLEWPETAKNKLIEKLIDIYVSFTRDSQLAQIQAAQPNIA